MSFLCLCFYSFFTMVPRGKYVIRVCMGTACYVKGAQEILNILQDKLGVGLGETTPDGKFTIEVVRCIGACALAPVVIVNNDDVFGNLDLQGAVNILSKYD